MRVGIAQAKIFILRVIVGSLSAARILGAIYLARSVSGAGSRVAVVLFGEVRVFHRPHPSPNTDKGAITSIRKWFEYYEVKV